MNKMKLKTTRRKEVVSDRRYFNSVCFRGIIEKGFWARTVLNCVTIMGLVLSKVNELARSTKEAGRLQNEKFLVTQLPSRPHKKCF